MADTLTKLYEVIEERKADANPKKSYTAKLFKKGLNKICQKFGEEASELIIATLAETKKDQINESADVLYHMMVLWAEKGINPDDVYAELERRMGISGIDEKSERKKAKKN